LVHKFEEEGVFVDLPRTGRPSISEDVVETVKQTLHEGQSSSQLQIYSARSLARQSGIPNSTVLKVLKTKLHLHPYHVTLRQELKETDLQARLNFANWFLDKMDEEDGFETRVLWTDEAHFHLDGTLSHANCVIWSEENPGVTVTRSLHPARVTVWCGFTSNFILPPAFFNEGETITADRYLNVLQHHMVPHLRRRRNIVFMQDGAAPHVALRVRDFLRERFGDRVISRHFPWNWPARSPDLNPCDFFLWGYLKARVFLHHPGSIPDLKRAIEEEIFNLQSDLLLLTVSSLFDRLLCIISAKGGHIE
jgi:inhibitor of nuclear factor kappa-B kinase subunit alpha